MPTSRALSSDPVDTALLDQPEVGGPAWTPLVERRSRPSRTRAGVEVTPVPVDRGSWVAFYARMLAAFDAVAITAAVGIAGVALGAARPGSWAGMLAMLLLVPAWLAALAMSRAYESRFLGVGSEEFSRVVNASVRITAVIGVVGYMADVELSRGFLAVVLPVGTLLLIAERYGARKFLHQRRRTGLWSHRVLVVGTRSEVHDLVMQVRGEPHAGFVVVGACTPTAGDAFRSEDGLPVMGTCDDVVSTVRQLGADTVAVTASPGMTDQALRRMAWALEGTGVSIVVAPALTNVAGPRVSIRPVAGLPLLHVEEPELSGGRLLLKESVDRTLAALVLLLLSPVLVGLALAVRLDSSGPAVFRQTRVGRDGREFTLYKFRSMVVDAEEVLAVLQKRNESDADGLLFKMRDDPRVTKVGRLLRAYSLDELPQLLNVVRGDMSLVGPRPPLPSEVARYESDVQRRLLRKPGITGLWQVSGRSDLTWEESVRLDLFYVENWSLALDLQIVWKTMFAVLRRSGAY